LTATFPTRELMNRTFLILLTALSSTGCALNAQGNLSTEQVCHILVPKLHSAPHSASFREAIQDGRLSRCGAQAAEQMAAILRTSAEELAGQDMKDFVLRAAAIRDPLLAASSLEAAEDRGLPDASRIAALQIAVAQHDVRYWFPELLSGETSRESPICYAFVQEYAWQSRSALPSNYRERLLTTSTRIAADAGASAHLRHVASCAARIADRTSTPPSTL
jgi:hypothetical protein